jgi:radical SAM superfamily enzyme YgiQ (UPF0313 family)
VAEVTRLCKKIGIGVECFFVIGCIGETKSNIRETIGFARYLRKLGASRAHFHIATPFEGTELYRQAQEMGYLRQPEKDGISMETLRIETPEFTCADIDQFFEEGAKVNPIIPTGRLRLALRTLVTDPIRFLRISLGYLIKRRAKWA